MTQIPEGFELAPARGQFTEVNGPFYKSAADGDRPARFGFVVEPRHCNGLGVVHGGMISTFLDSAMAQSVFDRFRRKLVTLNLNIDFESPGLRRRWMEATVDIAAPDADEVVANAELTCGGRLCARGRGVYRLLGRI